MKNRFFAFCCTVLIFLITGCPEQAVNGTNSNNQDKPDPDNPGNPVIPAKYAAEFRGEWIRMDTGDRWYISGDSIRVNGVASSLDVTMQKTSDNVTVATGSGNQKYTLFVARVANAGFNAQIVLLDDEPSAGRSSQGTTGQKPPVRIVNPAQPDQVVTAQPDPDTGEIKVTGVIPGDRIEIIPETSEWEDINVELIPGFGENQNLGVIPLTHGDNFKVSLVEDSSGTDLYAYGNPRTYTFELENIGTTICGETRLDIEWDPVDFSHISGSLRQDYTNIAPGEKKQLSLTLASLPIETETKDKKFNIKIRNYDSASMKIRTWDDTASVKFYNTPVPFHFRSEKQVQGVIKSKNGKSYYFKTERTGSAGDYTVTVNIPWSKDEYTIAFLGATIEAGSAAKYSFAIDAPPPYDWDDLDIWDFLAEYKPHNAFEDSAPLIDLSINKRSFMGYLAGDSIDYYKVKLSSTPPEHQLYTITYDNNGGSGTMDDTIFLLNVSQNLRLNTFTNPGLFFIGWSTTPSGPIEYANAQNVRNLTTVAGDTVTLYAVWGTVGIAMGANLSEKLIWLENFALSDVNYLIEINADESIDPTVLSYPGRENIGIILRSTDVSRTISLLSTGSMFSVRAGVTLTLENNIILRGRSDNTSSLVFVIGEFIMSGGEISGNTITSFYSGGGVSVSNGGIFTMYGGKISGNTVLSDSSSGGGVSVGSSGIFTMYGGEISGNTASSSVVSYGGGVFTIGSFTMYGGKISGNTASSSSVSYGGGVQVLGESGFFTMHGGEIYGNTSTAPSSYGGGVHLAFTSSAFRITGGTIYGSNASPANLRNTASSSAALSSPSGISQYGTFNGDIWNSRGNLSSTNNTIRVVNGDLQ